MKNPKEGIRIPRQMPKPVIGQQLVAAMKDGPCLHGRSGEAEQWPSSTNQQLF